jgi:hypothetical protein
VIPASVEIIGEYAFHDCTLLRDVTFLGEAHLKFIGGFSRCGSLRRIEIPASVEWIGHRGFVGGAAGRELVFVPGTNIQTVCNPNPFRAFIVYADNDDVKQRRRRFQLKTSSALKDNRREMNYF